MVTDMMKIILALKDGPWTEMFSMQMKQGFIGSLFHMEHSHLKELKHLDQRSPKIAWHYWWHRIWITVKKRSVNNRQKQKPKMFQELIS